MTRQEQEDQALADLQNQAATDLERTELDGHWSAQLASKDVGVTDTYQRTASGSHTFEAADILAEHQRLRDRLSPPYTIRLLYGPDAFGTDDTDGRALWYTFAVDNFDSKKDVEQFCKSAFPELGKDERGNQCFPRRLSR
ncbi:hypothetical protein [uncultured Friedmanniella sp.]|uniref:hypothetical protein n=1 Tax=uncultured Friedmanniella sp. TaxID=335381 RepID=UPI0035CB5FEC